MRKRILGILSMLTAAALVLACLPAAAAGNDDGWLSIKVGGKRTDTFDPEGIQLVIYLIARGDYGEWTMEKDFSDITIFTGNDGATRIDQSMDKLKERIRNRNIPYTQLAKTDKNGKAQFTSLKHGIYFVQMRSGPEGLTLSPMLLATPNKQGEVRITANAKYDYDEVPPDDKPKIPKIIVPTKPGEKLVPIDDYETALGLGNIQIHVGVCFE